MQILVLHGPNLNLLGTREPQVYGSTTLEQINTGLADYAAARGASLSAFQSNHEGARVDRVHAARTDGTAFIIINPGALTHSSWALRDALDAFDGFAIEVHISNPAAREPFRHVSTVAGVVDGSIAGFGAFGYELAAYSVLRHLS